MKKIQVLIAAFMLTAGSLTAQTIVDSVLYIADGTTEIKNSAYYGRMDFYKVVIPESVTKINGLAFHSCANLREIEIPASVTSIGNSVFENCTSLAKVTLHNGFTKLNYRVFYGTAIDEIYIPASVTDFGTEVFSTCDNLTTIRVDRYSEAHAYYNIDARLALTDNEPAQTKEQWIAASKYNIIDEGILYVGLGVTKINNNQYKDNQNITEIQFKDTVTEISSIGTSAFRNCTGLKRVVIPGNVKSIGDWAFAGCSNLEEIVFEEGVEKLIVYAFVDCPKLQSVTLPKSIQSIKKENILTENKSTRVFHCWLGSEACRIVMDNNNKVDIIGVDTEHVDSIDLKHFAVPDNKTIKAGLFQNLAFERVDLNNDLTEIGENAFHPSTIIRAKQNTYGDTWAKANGYYLCGVLADLNFYSKDASKQIEEDFTRILCDDDSYLNLNSYKFRIQEPLRLEEIDDKLVLTSFMLYPCENVTVTTKDGKTLISNKTIYPLTRTVLCDYDFLTDKLEDFTLTTDDAFYQRLVSIPTQWTISFNSSPHSPVNLKPVHAREYIAGIYNVAYIFGLPEYAARCYDAVENKTLATNEELTEFLTKEQMDELLGKSLNCSIVLMKCKDGFGVAGGATLYLDNHWILGLSQGTPNGFWHEFSHNMGWGHEDGNMCNDGRPEPFNVDWPSIGSILYQEEFKKGATPYIEGKAFFNSNLFSSEYLNAPDPEADMVINNVLYIGEGMPRVESYKNQTDFAKVVIPSSVEVIQGSALYGTAIQEITIPSSVKKIENQAFQSSALQSVTIPDGVKSIGDAAFQNCTSLASAEIGSGLRQLNYRLFKGSGLTEIAIPANVKVIGKECFQDCANLKKVTIADGVRKIDNSAFKNTAIEEIEIPASVTEIGTGITPKTAVWIVEKDSYAHQYAVENNMSFKIKSENDNQTSVTEQITNINIYTSGKTIIVENASDEILVYDVMGRLVCRDATPCVRAELRMDGAGVYIVKVGNLEKKVIVE
ncbi:MAG: leucine-rich repeat protein [Bacteroidales bacterium]|nr:leucine-rich repeat protein [Bacteroidales bacterium]